MVQLTRRDFIKKMTLAGIGMVFANLRPLSSEVFAQSKAADIAVASGNDPALNTYQVINALGGIKKFVREGARVVIKPNIAWNRTPEQAGNTNPEIVAALVEMCNLAGAGHISVWDNTCHNSRDTYLRSGIQKAAIEAGARVHYVNMDNFIKTKIPGAKFLPEIEIYREVLECDVFINVPVAKVHGLSTLTLGMKNLMGVIKDRPVLHDKIHDKLPELHSIIKPHLTVLDASRILTAHGPQGGDLKDVKIVNQVAASTDLVAVDAYGATLFGYQPKDIGFIVRADELGLGDMELSRTRLIKC
ncbi:MAG: DUF362 domain-containing protein [Candidatus Omnitrophota bacterium]